MTTVTTQAQVIIVKPGQTKHDLLNGRIPFNLFPINWKKSNGLVQPRLGAGACCHIDVWGPSSGKSRLLAIVKERYEILISYGWQRFDEEPSCVPISLKVILPTRRTYFWIKLNFLHLARLKHFKA